ncbi:MAG: hypothetical protein LC620_06760, partial [Halobacteriales archaeon]|nr:hypothetical protein [Halobacteriales archaeon]
MSREAGGRWHRRAALLLALLVAIPAHVAATPITTMPSLLPHQSGQAAAIWSGQYAYVFGGLGFDIGPGGTDRIVRYDPATGVVTILAAVMPERRYGLAAAFDGVRYAYIVGGNYNVCSLSCTFNYPVTILRFDTLTETIATMPAVLPWSTYLPSAAWDGSRVDIFGGCISGQDCKVVRYDPATNVVAQSSVSLYAASVFGNPWFNQQGAAVAGCDGIYLFGGSPAYVDNSAGRNAVFRYDPAADTLALLVTPLADSRHAVSAVWDGLKFYVYGGENSGGLFQSTILTYDPVAATSAFSTWTLPQVSQETSTVYAGAKSYILAGNTAT